MKLKRLLLLTLLAGSSALAVVDTPPVPAPVVEDGGPIRLDLPVTWQVTRARIEASGVKAETESFRETWTLVFHPNAYATLKSPRAEAKFYPGQHRLAGGVPASILLMESDFARLVGLDRHFGDLDTEDAGDDAVKGRMITLSLAQSTEGASFTLHLSPEEHFAINLSIGDFTRM